MMEAVASQTITVVTNTSNEATANSTTVLTTNTVDVATFKSNDYQVVPKYTQFDINIDSVPDVVKDSIDNMGSSLQTQINADRDRLDAIDDGTNTQIVLLKNADQAITAELNAYKSTTDNAIAGIMTDYVTKTQNDLSEAQLRTSVLSEIAGEYPTLAYIGTNLYTKAETDSAIATKETLLQANIDTIDAKYNQVLDVSVDGQGNATSQSLITLQASIEGNSAILDDHAVDIGILQSQVDGVVETVFDTHDVVNASAELITTAEPYASWLATDTANGNDFVRSNHTGDTYVKYELIDGEKSLIASYRFAKLATPNVPETDADGFGFFKLIDSGTAEALQAALNAQATADGKISTYYKDTAPRLTDTPVVDGVHIGFDAGDLWIEGDNNNKLWRYDGTSWVDMTDTHLDARVDIAEATIASNTGDITLINNTTIPSIQSDITAFKTGVLNADSSYVWADASKVVSTEYNGNTLVTGFTMVSGQSKGQTLSKFGIIADDFTIYNNTGYVPPFSISGNDIVFNGKVSFNSVTDTDHLATQDDIDEIPKPNIISENFEYDDSTHMKTAWRQVNGSGTNWYLSDYHSSGSHSIGMGDDSSIGDIWVEYSNKILFDPSKLYKISCKARQVDATTSSVCHIGLVCYAADGVTKLNKSGLNKYTYSHYIAASSQTLTTDWKEFTGYFKGTSISNVGGQHPDIADPAKLYSGTTYITPILVANYRGDQDGSMRFDDIYIEEVINPAEVINNNTTTIDGGKITTGSIAALQIAAGSIQTSHLTTGLQLVDGEVKSSDFTTIGGAGFRLKSNAASTNADPEIYGAYIRGGTVDSVTINASTINIRNLALLNDQGKATEPFFSSTPYSSGVVVDGNTMTGTIYLDFYTYDSTSTSSKRGVGTTGTTAFFMDFDSKNPLAVPLQGYIPIAGSLSSNFSAITVKINAGTTTLTSKTTSWSTNTDYSLGGFIFRLVYNTANTYDYILCVKDTTSDISLSSTSSSPINIYWQVTTSSSKAAKSSGLAMLVSNL